MSNKTNVAVWDLLVRVFHWSLVLFFIIAYASSEESEDLHEFAGYAVLGLIVVRVVWGFIGSQYARFSEFVYSPKQVMEYLRSVRAGNPRHYLGHNPLGGWMVIALLAMLFVVTLSGVKLESIKEAQEEAKPAIVASAAVGAGLKTEAASDEDGDNDNKGNLVKDNAVKDNLVKDNDENNKENEESEDSPQEKFWEEFHEAATDILLGLIALHIFGVISSSRLHKENLVKAMISGKKER